MVPLKPSRGSSSRISSPLYVGFFADLTMNQRAATCQLSDMLFLNRISPDSAQLSDSKESPPSFPLAITQGVSSLYNRLTQSLNSAKRSKTHAPTSSSCQSIVMSPPLDESRSQAAVLTSVQPIQYLWYARSIIRNSPTFIAYSILPPTSNMPSNQASSSKKKSSSRKLTRYMRRVFPILRILKSTKKTKKSKRHKKNSNSNEKPIPQPSSNLSLTAINRLDTTILQSNSTTAPNNQPQVQTSSSHKNQESMSKLIAEYRLIALRWLVYPPESETDNVLKAHETRAIELTQANANLIMFIKSLEQDIEQETREKTLLKDSLQATTNQLLSLEHTHSALEVEYKNYSYQANSHIHELNQQLFQMNQYYQSAASASAHQQQVLNDNITMLKDADAQLRAKIQSLEIEKNEHAKSTEREHSLLIEGNQQLQRLLTEKSHQLQQAIDSLRVKDSVIERFENDLIAKNNIINNATAEMARMEASMTAMQHTSEMAESRAQSVQLEAEQKIRQLEAQYQHLCQSAQESFNIQAAQLQSMSHELHVCKEAHSLMQIHLVKLQEENVALESQLSSENL